MDRNYVEEITIANAATNTPGIDVSIVRDYMTGRTPEVKCKECKFKAAQLEGPTYCNKQKRIVYATGCNYGELKPITNADRIRAMTDEELAHTLWLTAKGGIIGQRSEDAWLDWLKQEVSDDER